jgi:antitoxin component of RelBE/YafQ-DinJ toxin-antitoxin module
MPMMTGKEVVTSFRVDEDLWRQTRSYAVLHGITVKQLIEFLLKKELKENNMLKGERKEKKE